MNNDLSTTGGGELSQTGNPQIIGGQNLGAPASNLQQNPNSILSQQGLKINSVGSSKFTTVNLSTQASQSANSTNSPSPSETPFILSLGLVALVIVVLVVLAVKKGKPPEDQTAD